MLLLLAAALPAAGLAQTTLVEPQLVSQGELPVANNASGEQVEAWAIVSYSVLANGTTDNVRVIDIAPPSVDPDSAIDAVGSWRFSPATADGDPIDWHRNEAVVLYASAGDTTEAASSFTDAYQRVSELLEAQMAEPGDDGGASQIEQASVESARLTNELAVRRHDIGLAMVQAALIEIRQQGFQQARRLISLATHPDADGVPGYELFVALQVQFRIETQLSRTLDALATYDRIAAGLGPDDGDGFAATVATLQAVLVDEPFLPAFGQIGDLPWSIDLSRRYFYIDSIEGDIDTLTAACDRRLFSIEFQADADYAVPEDWGACTLYVEGQPGTSFTLVEVMPEDL